MEKLKSQKINSPLGVLFQIPIWLLSCLGLYKLLSTVFLSFTSYNVLEAPRFIGFENFSKISNDDITQIALSNTRVFVIVAAVLLIITAVIPALLISKLRLPFGLAALAGYFLVSLSAMLPSSWNYIFSGDSYGMLNSFYLSVAGAEPVMWNGEFSDVICIIVLFFICMAPVFAITYIGARMGKPSVGSAIALCSIPVLMVANSSRLTAVVGYPSVDYNAEWLPTIIGDYAKTRFEVGYASALTVTGILMLLVWCAVNIGLTIGISCLLKRIIPDMKNLKTSGYIAFGFAVILSLAFLLITFVCSMSNALKPLDEFFVFPSSVLVKHPTFKNFSDLFTFYSNLWFNPANSLSGIGRLFVIYILAILPCAVGFAVFKVCKKQGLLLLPLIGLTGLAHELQINYSVANLQAGSLLSGISCAMLILVSFLVIKIMLYPSENRNLRIILGVFCLITAFFATAAATLNFGTYTVYEQKLQNWRYINTMLASSGIARLGVCAAADILMILFTVVTAIIPLVLLSIIYLLYRKAVIDNK